MSVVVLEAALACLTHKMLPPVAEGTFVVQPLGCPVNSPLLKVYVASVPGLVNVGDVLASLFLA